MADVLKDVANYYTDKLRTHGETPNGVDWNSEAGQVLRFEQLAKVIDGAGAFSVSDLGCGYGAFYGYVKERFPAASYLGCDVSEAMVEAAARRFPDPQAKFVVAAEPPEECDFAVASGIFNVKLGSAYAAWLAHVEATLDVLDSAGKRGFAFNCLTSYSDKDRMREDLYYADPCRLFDLCKRRYSKQVALLHDYGLYEFTILVRKPQP